MSWRKAFYAALTMLLVSPVAAPQLLAFPYSGEVGAHRVYSEQPITAELREAVAKGDALAARSPIAPSPARQPIFLTNGGWRWTWLTLTSRSAFAISRPVIETIVVNRFEAGSDTVVKGRPVGGRRSLSGTIAHEITHGSIRSHFGPFADLRYPEWLREGYCDHVAGGGLSDAEAERLMASDPGHPALTYWRGRRQVAGILQRNGGSVDKLFASSGA